MAPKRTFAEANAALAHLNRWGRFFENDTQNGQTTAAYVGRLITTTIMLLNRIGVVSILQSDAVLKAIGVRYLGQHIYVKDDSSEPSWDIPFDKRTDQDDLNEYLAFLELIKPLSPYEQTHLKSAYLLWYARRMPGCFPVEAKNQIFSDSQREISALLQAAEAYDMLAYANGMPDLPKWAKMKREANDTLVPILDQLAREYEKVQIIWPGKHHLITQHPSGLERFTTVPAA